MTTFSSVPEGPVTDTSTAALSAMRDRIQSMPADSRFRLCAKLVHAKSGDWEIGRLPLTSGDIEDLARNAQEVLKKMAYGVSFALTPDGKPLCPELGGVKLQIRRDEDDANNLGGYRISFASLDETYESGQIRLDDLIEQAVEAAKTGQKNLTIMHPQDAQADTELDEQVVATLRQRFA